MREIRVVLSLSGGLDSAVLLADLCKSRGPAHVLCCSFEYGSKHAHKEAEAARRLTDFYGVEHRVLPLTALPFRGSSLTDPVMEVPDGAHTDASMKSTVVPCRNLVFVSILAAWAESVGAGEVALGVHAGDRAIYPDCRYEFVVAADKAVKLATSDKVKLITPFVDWDKSQIVRHGKSLNVPFELTWTCYKGGDTPCTTCGACSERCEAFAKNKLTDPL